jgi:hypothetical protein
MIKINPKSIRKFNRAIDRLKRKLILERENLPMYSAIDYVHRLNKNLTSQKFSASYPSYSSLRYATWKEKYFPGSLGFWHLRGFVLKSLRPFKVSGGWIGGIRGDLMVPGSSWFGEGMTGEAVRLSDIAYWMEYGRRRQPPRPLFNPTLSEFIQIGWPIVITKSISKMKATWI